MQFQKWPKINFWTGKKFKTAKNAISRKNFLLISYPDLDCTETRRNLYKDLECTIHSIVRFPAKNFDYIPDCIHIHPDRICLNISRKPPADQADRVPGFRPWKNKFRKSDFKSSPPDHTVGWDMNAKNCKNFGIHFIHLCTYIVIEKTKCTNVTIS